MKTRRRIRVIINEEYDQTLVVLDYLVRIKEFLDMASVPLSCDYPHTWGGEELEDLLREACRKFHYVELTALIDLMKEGLKPNE